MDNPTTIDLAERKKEKDEKEAAQVQANKAAEYRMKIAQLPKIDPEEMVSIEINKQWYRTTEAHAATIKLIQVLSEIDATLKAEWGVTMKKNPELIKQINEEYEENMKKMEEVQEALKRKQEEESK